MGSAPDWYRLLRAARYLGVAPWELAARPLVWQEWAILSESAEVHAEQDAAKRAQQKKMRG